MSNISMKQSMVQWAEQARLATTDGYCADPSANMPWLNTETERELREGDGHEFGEPGSRPKIAALHSSSALAVNVFDYWRHRDDKGELAAPLGLANEKIESISFEQKFPTGVGPRSPNLDVVIGLENGEILAIESKFTEWMAHSGRKALRDEYLPRDKSRWSEAGLPAAQAVATEYMNVPFDRLDVPQILKHMLGLAHTYREKPWRLLLLWHRCDDALAPEMECEIARFQEMLGTDGARFYSMTYQEFWKRMAPYVRPKHPEYVKYITLRYFGATPTSGRISRQKAAASAT